MNIKRLQLDKWMVSKKSNQNILGFEPYLEITPTIGKNGLYKSGLNCWFEVDGKAYTYPINMFKYDFKIIEVNEYDNREIKALSEIVRLGLATKKQKEIVSLYKLFGKKLNVEDLRKYKRFIAFRNKVKEKQASLA